MTPAILTEVGVDKNRPPMYIVGPFRDSHSTHPTQGNKIMTTTAQPEVNGAVATQYSLQNPPQGFYFDTDEVKGDRGQKSYGQRPLLSLHESEEGVRGAIAFYGYEGVARIHNGTSLRVTAQGIARRVTEKGLKEGWDNARIDAEIAKAQLEYRPGKRQGGQSTAQSRAVNAAKKAAGKISGDGIASMLEKIATMSDDQRAAFASSMGLDPAVFATPVAEEEDEEQDEQQVEGEQPQG